MPPSDSPLRLVTMRQWIEEDRMETALLESTPLEEASFPSRFKTQGTAGSHGIFTHRRSTILHPILPSCLKCHLPSRPWGPLLLSPKVTLGNLGVSPFSLWADLSALWLSLFLGCPQPAPPAFCWIKSSCLGWGVMTVPFPIGMWLLF